MKRVIASVAMKALKVRASSVLLINVLVVVMGYLLFSA
jgi:hypothetical protein